MNSMELLDNTVYKIKRLDGQSRAGAVLKALNEITDEITEQQINDLQIPLLVLAAIGQCLHDNI